MLIVNKGAVYSPQTEFCEAKANLEPLVIAAYKKSKLRLKLKINILYLDL